MQQERDMKDPRYAGWRYSVFILYKYTCALCGEKGGKLEAHHIVRWADNEKLRFAVSNGACLCKTCHATVTGREKEYEDYFRKLTNQLIKERRVENNKYKKKSSRRKRHGEEKGLNGVRGNKTSKIRKWRPKNPRTIL